MHNASVDFDAEVPQRTRIVLIGFMGAGKTTLAQRWAQEIPGPALWFDSDHAVCLEMGVERVSDAFDDHGEAGFRQAERDIITRRAESLMRGVEVWSLGGGSILDPDVQRCLLDATVVWVDAPVDVLWERVQGSDRPLAQDRDAFEQLYELRRDVYASLATIRIETDTDIDDVELPRTLAPYVDIDALCSGLTTGHGLLGRVEDLAVLSGRSAILVSDTAAAHVTDIVADRLNAAGCSVLLDQRIAMGEWHKQIGTVEQVVTAWTQVGVNRSTVVIAIGGGTLLDVAGFAAAIWQRGIDWVSIPTTLTAQVDAGIGGKTGVNLAGAKNVLGAVHMPVVTLIDPGALATLPEEHLADGFVEVAKTALLAGETLARMVYDLAASRPVISHPDWLRVIDACAAYKDRVVAEDPLDIDGIRAQLNLGHTLGHALESATSGSISHGRAVAIGIHAALRLSCARLEADADLIEWWQETCDAIGVSTTSNIDWTDLEPWLALDKKHDGSTLNWVLLRRAGTPVTGVSLEPGLVHEVWNEHVRLLEAANGRKHDSAGHRVLVLFGINLGELGRRDEQHYGAQTLAEVVASIQGWASEFEMVAECRQTDSLERFISAIREARDRCSAVIVNPGAWTHHERALHDALEPLSIPRVEVHLSNVDEREAWRRESVIEGVVDHRVVGRGAEGYREAIAWLHDRLDGSTQ